MNTLDFKVNGKTLHSNTPTITGEQILEAACLVPASDYELLHKVNEKGFEPVQLDEVIDLRKAGVEGFRAKPYKKLEVLIDDQTVEVDECFLTPVELLSLVGLSPKEAILYQTKGDVEIGYENDLDHKVAVCNKQIFKTVKKPCVIIVNTRSKEWSKETISFEEVVTLAYGSCENNGRTLYTVTYSKGVASKPKGSLTRGESVEVKCKMIWNVTPTDKS